MMGNSEKMRKLSAAEKVANWFFFGLLAVSMIGLIQIITADGPRRDAAKQAQAEPGMERVVIGQAA